MPLLHWRRTIPALVWALFILVLSVMPATELPTLHIWEPDKVLHAICYAILTICVYFMLRRDDTRGNAVKRILFACLLCILYGICIEIIQRFLPGRQFDVYDILANTLGTLPVLAWVLVISNTRKA